MSSELKLILYDTNSVSELSVNLNYDIHGCINPIQAGVFWNHIQFLLHLLSNYHQTWHDSTMAQNLSRAVKVKSIMMSL